MLHKAEQGNYTRDDLHYMVTRMGNAETCLRRVESLLEASSRKRGVVPIEDEAAHGIIGDYFRNQEKDGK